MAAVALLNAEAGSAPSGTGSFSYFSNARVVVENLAFELPRMKHRTAFILR